MTNHAQHLRYAPAKGQPMVTSKNTPADADHEQEHDDPMLRTLRAAPVDDEALTPDDEAALDEAYADLQRGAIVSGAEVRRRLGLVD